MHFQSDFFSLIMLKTSENASIRSNFEKFRAQAAVMKRKHQKSAIFSSPLILEISNHGETTCRRKLVRVE